MSVQTWKIVTLALALTASLVIAKTLIPAPEQASANPDPAVALAPTPQPLPETAARETGRIAAVPPAAEPEPQAEPLILPPAHPPELAPPEPPQPPEPAQDPTWIVTVVRGDRVELIRYPNPFVKAPVVIQPEEEQEQQ